MEYLDEIGVRLFRLGRDLQQGVVIHVVRDADGEDFDAGRLRRRRFGDGEVYVLVGRTVGDQEEDFGNAGSSAVEAGKHVLAGLAQGGGDVRVAAHDFQL